MINVVMKMAAKVEIQHIFAGFLSICLLLPGLARADFDYPACIALTESAPERALARAEDRYRTNGDTAAGHCKALALIALDRPEDAAQLLQELAGQTDRRQVGLQADLLSQAGNAWLLAGQPDRARRTFDRALTLAPTDSETLVDRARSLAEIGSFDAAIRDLGKALNLDPGNPTALILRASAFRTVNQPKLALADLAQVLAADPKHAAALIERGLVHRQMGNGKMAIADWQDVIRLAANTDFARIAQKHLDAIATGSN